MKTYTKNLKIVKIERINSSCNGTPAYRMIVEDEVIYKMHGKYNIYNSHNGVVVFKKISD